MTVHDARFPKFPDTDFPGPGAYTVCTAVTLYCCSMYPCVQFQPCFCLDEVEAQTGRVDRRVDSLLASRVSRPLRHNSVAGSGNDEDQRVTFRG